jgi:hypothetical protein
MFQREMYIDKVREKYATSNWRIIRNIEMMIYKLVGFQQ